MRHLLLLAAALPLAFAADPVRVMVVTGGHQYDTSFDSLFEGYSDINAVAYSRDIAFRGDLRSNWDVLVLYDFTTQSNDAVRQRLPEFLEAGKGLVVLHHALADFNDWAWWSEEVVGGKFLMRVEGARPASTYKQGVEVIYTPAPHAITAGLKAMRLVEEPYKLMWISAKSKPLLKADSPYGDPVLAWIGPYEKSRVVAIQPGHDRRTHVDAGYRALIHNALLWAAGRKDQ